MLFPEANLFPTVAVQRVIRRDEIGQHRPALCQDAQGRLWWAKAHEDMLWNGMLAEATFCALARVVDAAVPDGALAHVPGMGWCWLSRDVESVAHWSDVSPEGFGNADRVGAAIALDAVLHNEDRHEANVLVQIVDATERQLWWIDADVAAVSTPGSLTAKGLAPPDPRRMHIRGLPISQLHAGAAAAAAALSRFATIDQIAHACALSARAPTAEHGKLAAALRTRLAAAPQIVDDYLDSLRTL